MSHKDPRNPSRISRTALIPRIVRNCFYSTNATLRRFVSMEITDPPTCSTCGQPAETRCTGCIEGLDEQGKPTAVVYCSKTCQKVAWPTHKPDCKISNHRKQLYRAGSLVQKAFHEFRQAAFDVPVLKVEKVQGKLHARIAMSVPGRILFNFPADQFIKEEDKNAMLCWRTCDDAVGRMWPLVSMTLSGEHVVCQFPSHLTKVQDFVRVSLNLFYRLRTNKSVLSCVNRTACFVLTYRHRIGSSK